MIGRTLGPYQVVAKLGEGGMGEVYRATRHEAQARRSRSRCCRPSFAADADRLARFQREAEVLAVAESSEHRGASTASKKSDGVTALVMELVEGEDSVAAVIARRRQIPLDEALPIAQTDRRRARSRARAGHHPSRPEAREHQGAADGTVKVLDFGLPRRWIRPASTSPTRSQLADDHDSPAMTQMGMILGTAAYMCPSRRAARPSTSAPTSGRLACVLFEMLTGTRAFDGEDIVDDAGARSSRASRTGRAAARRPPRVRRVAATLPAEGLRSSAQATSATCASRSRARSRRPLRQPQCRAEAAASRARLAWVVGGHRPASLAAGLALPAVRHSAGAAPTARPIEPLRCVACRGTRTSPSRRAGGYWHLSVHGGGSARLWVRPLDSLDARPIPGTEGADLPFWSPDEEHLGFFAAGQAEEDRRCRRPAETLCDAPTPRGGTWNRDGVIVFAPNIARGSVSCVGRRRRPCSGHQARGSRQSTAFPNSSRAATGSSS